MGGCQISSLTEGLLHVKYYNVVDISFLTPEDIWRRGFSNSLQMLHSLTSSKTSFSAREWWVLELSRKGTVLAPRELTV